MSGGCAKREREAHDDSAEDRESKRAHVVVPGVETDAPVVCAIDFGTACTGVAFAFTSKPEIIKVLEPGGQDPGKTFTSVLLDTDGKFLAFGPKARKKYYDAVNDCSEQRPETGMLFEKFKMRLHRDDKNDLEYARNGSNHAIARNSGNFEVWLMRAITLSLKYVKDEAMTAINRSLSDVLKVHEHEIKWVVTVPAIWSDPAKGMMRKASFHAGMISGQNSANLVLCLEPEAACMACEDQRNSPLDDGAASAAVAASLQILKNGDTFMVLDCGGGTVDITAHHVVGTNPLRLAEARKPSGGPWGSTYVDQEFEQFLQAMIGEDSWKLFKSSSAWAQTMEEWEATKCAFDPSEKQDDPSSACSMRVAALSEALRELPVPAGGTELSLSDLVRKYNTDFGGQLESRRSILKIPFVKMQHFFANIIRKIVAHVQHLIQETSVNYIYLVGGFAESKMLQMQVKSLSTSEVQVIVPMYPQFMVVTGAVLFGLQKGSTIESRVARLTYGYLVLEHWKEKDEIHKKRGFQIIDGVKYVNGQVFKSLVEQGSTIKVLHTETSQVCSPADKRNSDIVFQLYSSQDDDVKFFNPAEAIHTRIGEVRGPCADGEFSTLSISFGSTEIRATAFNETTKVSSQADINFNFDSV